MADGSFAALMFALGLLDMGAHYCGGAGGCLARSETQPRLSVSGGSFVRRRAMPTDEIYLRYDLGYRIGPFGNAVGLSLAANGETWIGFGQTYTLTPADSPFFAELHAMPGLYAANGGFDLGGPIEFRSGIEIGYEGPRGMRIGLSYDHRSNAGLFPRNPGVETVQIRIGIPLR